MASITDNRVGGLALISPHARRAYELIWLQAEIMWETVGDGACENHLVLWLLSVIRHAPTSVQRLELDVLLSHSVYTHSFSYLVYLSFCSSYEVCGVQFQFRNMLMKKCDYYISVSYQLLSQFVIPT